MYQFSALLLLLTLGCATVVSDGVPQTYDEWAVRCTRIAEDNQPNKHERFDVCVQQWSAWVAEQRGNR